MIDDIKIGQKIREVRQARGSLTQLAFASKLGVSRGAVANWESGKGIKRENLVAIAREFGVSVEWLSTDQGTMDSIAIESPNAIVGDKIGKGARLIPLYGQAVGGQDGEFVLNGNKLADITAPPSLSPVRGAYAVSISGDSMEPRYFDGETVFVDPERRVHRGDFVVAQIQLEEHGAKLAYVKRFVRWNEKELVLEQYNPPKQLTFPHKNVASVHFIVLGGTA